MRIGITGSPGVGKHTVAYALSSRLKMNVLDINEVALNSAVIGMDEYSYIVDTDRLKHMLNIDDGTLVVGHLLPYVLDYEDLDIVIVLRRSPYELSSIYNSRGYDDAKSKDNLASEILGIIAYDTFKQFKDKVVEFDTTGKDVDTVIEEILKVANGEEEGAFGHIDWLALVVSNDDLSRFFDYTHIC